MTLNGWRYSDKNMACMMETHLMWLRNIFSRNILLIPQVAYQEAISADDGCYAIGEYHDY
jgi:hypothetical protein